MTDDVLLKVEEFDSGGWAEGEFVEDPLGKVSFSDTTSYDSPEDQTCGRNMSQWIREVNRLRQVLVDHGIDPA